MQGAHVALSGARFRNVDLTGATIRGAELADVDLYGDIARQATSFEDRPDGIARDRWDVAIETVNGMMLVECGAIRERVSQELARTVYDAVKGELERRDAATTPSREPRRGDSQPAR